MALHATIIFFHAPWCGHCRSSMPEVRAAEALLAALPRPSHGAPTGRPRVVMVDCTVHEDVARERNIQGFPTVQIILGNNHTERVGRLNRWDLVDFYQRSLGVLSSALDRKHAP
jgi:thiol-disulfide isomerase/thioredoxin